MKFLQLQLKKLRHKVVLSIFNRYYGRYVYDFKKAEDEFNKLPEPTQMQCYEDITNWLNSEAYKIVGQGEVRGLYEELANEAKTEDVMTAYRLALLKHKSEDVYLRSKAEYYKQKRIITKKSNSFERQYGQT